MNRPTIGAILDKLDGVKVNYLGNVYEVMGIDGLDIVMQDVNTIDHFATLRISTFMDRYLSGEIAKT